LPTSLGCNSNWFGDRGEVWCTTLSGGIQRDWVGTPRKLFTPGKTRHRCICASKETIDHPHLKEYSGCPKDSEKCQIWDSLELTD